MEDANPMRKFWFATVRTQIIGPCARMLELSPLVWSGAFFVFVFVLREKILSVIFAPFPEEEIWTTQLSLVIRIMTTWRPGVD